VKIGGNGPMSAGFWDLCGIGRHKEAANHFKKQASIFSEMKLP